MDAESTCQLGRASVSDLSRSELEAEIERLRALAFSDALTGVSNRRGIMAVLDGWGEVFVGVVLFDLDHFKRVNDRFGHGAGDRILIEVARSLGESLVDGEVVARWGGDEFLVAACGVNDARLALRVAGCLTAVNAMLSSDLQARACRVQLRAGWSADSLALVGVDELIDLADLRLLRSKSRREELPARWSG